MHIISLSHESWKRLLDTPTKRRDKGYKGEEKRDETLEGCKWMGNIIKWFSGPRKSQSQPGCRAT